MLDLSHLRNEIGLTQAELADELRVSLRTIQNWEGGEIAIPKKKVKFITQEIERLRLSKGKEIIISQSSPVLVRFKECQDIKQNHPDIYIDMLQYIEDLEHKNKQLKERLDFLLERLKKS